MRTPIFLVCAFLFGTGLRAQSHALLPQFQGMTGVTWTTPLIADSLPAVDSYEFEVTTAAGHFVEIIGSVDHVFTLSETGLAGDLEREVTVRVRTISSGTASSFGAPVSFVTDGAFVHPCGPVSDIEELWHTTPWDVQYREWREQRIQQAIPAVAAYRGGGCATSYRIPVVFHVVHDPSIPLSNIPDAVLLDQLYILNNEFNGPNINTLGENPCIEFCLAPNTPNGEDWSTDFNSTTPGITRWADPVATYHGNGPAAQAQLANVVMFPTDRYLNVWITSTVIDGPGDIVGQATFPGSSQPLDGVVIEYPFVAGYGGIPEHMEGFILVHEAGHYLGVYHTFNGTSCDAVAPGCEQGGDYCCDTPPVAQANTGGCSDLTPNSCGVPEQLENYMDYTFEFCKSTFTENQIERMHASLLTFRTELVSSANHIITGIAGLDGCSDPILSGAILSNGTQFCTNTSIGLFTGVLPVEAWTFSFFNSNGTLDPISGTDGVPATPPVTFPNAGPWTLTLTVTNTNDPPLGTASETITVFVSDCGPVIMEQAQWYFGQQCALDFTSGAPVAVGGSAIMASQGCASVADPITGTLDLYASNQRTFNSGHQGLDPPLVTGPTGSPVQGVVIIPDGSDPDRYYQFNVFGVETTGGPGELHFSRVDMNLLFGGFSGDFVPGEVNLPVGVDEPMVTEHLAAVPHCNGTDHWVVVHGFDANTSDQLLSYRLGPTGIILPPVVSPSFAVTPHPGGGFSWDEGVGFIKFNREGDLAAITHRGDASCHIYGFDRASGGFTHITELAPNTTTGDGISFSRSGDFLYTATRGGIWQHDLREFDPCDPLLPNNFHAFPSNTLFPALQLGPDDKIYMTNVNTDFVSVINYPETWNSSPNAFGFNWQGVTIEVPGNGVNEVCRGGLPNMIDARPTPGQIDFTWCGTDCENVTFSLLGCGAAIAWDVGCNSTVEGTGNVFTHAFPTPGSYCVSLTVDGVTVTHTVDILIPPTPDIGPDVVCMGVPVVFTSTNTAGLSHSWSLTGDGVMTGPDNEPAPEIWWTGPGDLTLEVTDAVTGCSNSVTVAIAPVTYQPDAGPDATVCVGEALELGTNLGTAVNCTWTPNSNLDLSSPCSPVFISTTTGSYPYTVHAVGANGCMGSDEVIVTVVDTSCDDFTIYKSATPTQTYAGSPVVFTITACNNTGAQATVSIVDQLPGDFTLAFTNGSNPLTGPVLLDPGCTDFLISGYFSTIGMCNNPDPDVVAMHTNTVTLDDGNGTVLTADACVGIMVGCPMSVAGTGGCFVDDPVNMCLLVHTQFTGVTAVDYQLLFPAFLSIPGAPPAGTVVDLDNTNTWEPFAGANIQGGGVSTISWQPYTNPYPGPLGFYNVATIHVEYTAPVNVSPPYQFLCIDFTLQSAPPAGQNAWSVFAKSPGNTLNQVQVTPVGTFYTQALNVTLTGCDGIDPPNAGFTVDVPNCGGAVTVNADLTDPGAVHIWTWGDDRTTPTNGAQTWTYDYFEPITDNQGWPVNIPPADPGTYTITHTVIVDGVASTSTQEITIYQCCEADLSVPDGTYSSSLSGSWSGISVDIQGQFIVDQDLIILNCDLYMEPSAEIIVMPGKLLDIQFSTVESCQGVMWKTITAQNGSTVRVRYSTVKDAENTFTGLNGSYVALLGNEFKNNRVVVHVPTVTGVTWNNVLLHVANNEFHSSTPMPLPYAGQATAVGQKGYAAFDVWRMNLDLSLAPNHIHHLSNGIVAQRSDVHVEQCTIEHIQPDAAYSFVGIRNGAGIYAQGRLGWHYLEQTGHGKNGAPSFHDCHWGIFTEYMNVSSVQNNMTAMGTAYRVERGQYFDVDIVENKVSTLYNGMEFRTNEGAAHVLVENNDITFGTAACTAPATCRKFNAIYVTEGGMANPSSVIRNNTIHFVNSGSSRYGINLLSADDWLVAENTLLMADNALNETGIWLQGCRRAEVSCNTVLGFNTIYPLKGQAAIRNAMGSDPLISCNDVDKTTHGILFNGTAYGTDLRGNKMRNHKWGLYLDNTAIIDAQTLKGNLWYDPPASGGLSAHNANSLGFSFSLFRYNPATIGGGNTQPPSWTPPGWFVWTSGTNYDCANDHGEDYCSQFNGKRGKDAVYGLDEKIASDSLENDPYTDETKWILKGDLYKKLDEHPALLDSLPDLADFYDALDGSLIAAFKQVDDGQLALYDLDSSVVATLQQNRQQLEDLMALVKAGMEQLADTSLTNTQQQALLATLGGYQQAIHDLAEYNATAMQLAATTKALTADNVKAVNAGLGTSELIETNQKQVNEVYLATIAKDVKEFTTEQATELFAIADQCPMMGGNAVYRARALYSLIDEEQVYDDETLCLVHGIITKRLTEPTPNTVSVIPNPASDEATLLLSTERDIPGVLIIFDALGAEVARHVVPTGSQRHAFNTAALAPALYHYKVLVGDGLIGDGKLTIVR